MLRLCCVIVLSASLPAAAQPPEPRKTAGVFGTPELVARAKSNAGNFDWAAAIRKPLIDGAAKWAAMSDDQLWSLMFGPRVTRSWMVWSNGFCPACRADVPMYTWRVDALNVPWKVECPHCKQRFPKNDFHSFYISGLDDHGVFDPKLADRSLLFNTDHPNQSDPLHGFGVDDGEGYAEGENRWRFIGAYLIYGQWKQAIVEGCRMLAAAYAATGDPAYAHKAGVLLDRVADLYPSFDFQKQGLVYEVPGTAGCVSTWHDACVETRVLALAYDQVFDALRNDAGLVEFLSEKARKHKLANPKRTFEDVQRNIENGILRDALANRPKIESNYPQTDITLATIETVLGWPANRARVHELLGGIIERATAVDGLTGEKGLTGYAAFSPQTIAGVLGQYERLEPGFIAGALKRHPRLYDSYRFFIDTWLFEQYYPRVGDCGSFAAPAAHYYGASFTRNPGLAASSFDFLWRLYEVIGDPAFVQVLYRANGHSVDGLPFDLFVEDPRGFQAGVRQVIDRVGTRVTAGSVDKKEWRLAILRSGEGDKGRALWLDYDSGERHGHADCMNLGLFAKGLDLLPDFGYPPVQYGGWTSPRAVWYTMTAAHNTVVVDGQNQPRSPRLMGSTTLWADGKAFRAIRASVPDSPYARQYERCAVLVDVSAAESYVFDVFRVVGGKDHAKFTRSSFGEVNTSGLDLRPCEDYGYRTQTRSYRADPSPSPGWSVEWRIADRLRLLPEGAPVGLRYTDLTTGASASVAEAWVTVGSYNATEEVWVPQVMVRRQSEREPLASTFVSVIEPFGNRRSISSIRRVPLQTLGGAAYPDSHVAVEVTLADGRTDTIVCADVENPLVLTPAYSEHNALVVEGSDIAVSGQMCLVRRSASGEVERIALCRGTSVRAGSVSLTAEPGTDYLEVEFERGKPKVVSRS